MNQPDLAELERLLGEATPGPWRAHDHKDMERIGEDPDKWMGYAWVGRITKQSEPDGRFDAGHADMDRRNDASKEYRERASTDAHLVAAALNALPALIECAKGLKDAEIRFRAICNYGDPYEINEDPEEFGGTDDGLETVCMAYENMQSLAHIGAEAARKALSSLGGSHG